MIALRWWTVRQTADFLGMATWTVRRLCRTGELPSRRDGAGVGAHPWFVDSWTLEEQMAAGWKAPRRKPGRPKA